LDNKLNNKKGKTKKFLEKQVNSIVILFLLTAIVSLITYYRILIQIDTGPIFDSIVFLANALVFAGQGTGYSNLLFPPFFPVIVSLIFRLGYVYATTIFVVDGVLFIFGVIGLYLLLKMRFNDFECFLGGLLYASFPIVLTILGLGLSDLASVSFSIWTIYFLVLSVKKDTRFFYLVFPFFMLAFLTRYNSALLIFPIFLYILINKDKVDFKNIIIGIFLSILIILPVFLFFYENFGNAIYPFISFASSSTIIFSTTSYYNPNIFFFLQDFPLFVGIQGVLFLLIIALAVVYFLFKFIRRNLDNKDLFKNIRLINRENKIKWIFFVIMGIIFLGSFGTTSYFLSELLFIVIAYIFYDLTKNKFKDIDLHLMVFVWFMSFFIFHSVYVIKDVRYFVVMAPPVAYFMILGLSEISNRIKFHIKGTYVPFPLLVIILTSIILLSTASQIQYMQSSNEKIVNIFNEQIESASQWLINYDPNYKNKNIYSNYLRPNFSWFLKSNVKDVPTF